MSYILDALKKSEQERGHGNIPGVQTVHTSSLSYRNEKSTYWPYVLITAVIINIALVLYFIFDKETATTRQAEVVTDTAIHEDNKNNVTDENKPSTVSTDNTELKTIKPPVADEPTEATTIKSSSTTTRTVALEEKPSVIETHNEDEAVTEKTVKNSGSRTEDGTAVIDFYSLPDSVKQELPAIIISAHVYSSNPLQRSIVINNNFMEEGEYVLDNLRLHEITPGGAIFDHNGTLFKYSVLSSWQ